MNVRITWLLLLVAALASGWIYHAAHPPAPSPGAPAGHVPEAYASMLETRRYDADGRLTQVLSARRMVRYADDASTELTAPALSLYPRNGPRWEGAAQRAILTDEGRRIELQEQVRIRRLPDARTKPGLFTTRRLLVFPERDEAETDRRITWKTPDLTVTAVGMRARLDTSEVDLLSRVRARLAPPRHREDG